MRIWLRTRASHGFEWLVRNLVAATDRDLRDKADLVQAMRGGSRA